MSATATEISEYIYNIRRAYVEYSNKLAIAYQIGGADLECSSMKLRVLKYLIRIIIDYFDSDDYENINFFTPAEARDIAQQINNICHSEYMIDF